MEGPRARRGESRAILEEFLPVHLDLRLRSGSCDINRQICSCAVFLEDGIEWHEYEPFRASHGLRNTGVEPHIADEVELLAGEFVGTLHLRHDPRDGELNFTEAHIGFLQPEISSELCGHILDSRIVGLSLTAPAQF